MTTSLSVGVRVVLVCMGVWPRFLFLKRDRRELIGTRGGRVVWQRRRQVDATIGAR
jgi:hypothetical protein